MRRSWAQIFASSVPSLQDLADADARDESPAFRKIRNLECHHLPQPIISLACDRSGKEKKAGRRVDGPLAVEWKLDYVPQDLRLENDRIVFRLANAVEKTD